MASSRRRVAAPREGPRANGRRRANGRSPHHDDPRRRYEELSLDRRQETQVDDLPRLRLAALAHRASMPDLDAIAGLASVPGTSNWVQLGPTAILNGQSLGGTVRILVTGRLTSMAIDPTNSQVMYVAAARGGIWKTTDGGDHWLPQSDNEVSLGIGAIALAPSNPQVLYAGTGEGNLVLYQQAFPLNSAPAAYQGAGVLRSANGGATWTQQGTAQLTGAAFFRIAVHPTDPNTAWAATSAGLFRTTNGGTTWAAVTAGLPAIGGSVIAASDVAIDPSNPSVVYVAFFGDGVFRTANGNAASPTWTAQALPLPAGQSAGRIALSIPASSPAQVFALVAGGSGGNVEGVLGLYQRGAGGAWTQVSVSLAGLGQQSSYNLNVAVDPTTPDILYVSALTLLKVTRNPVSGVWSSTNLGAGLHADHHGFAIDPTNHLVVYDLSDGGIYKSSNGGATWTDSINRDICVTQFEVIDQHPTTDAIVIGGTQDNGTEAYRGSPVFYHADEGDGGFVAIDHVNPRNVIHGYFSRWIARSTVGGAFGSANWPLINDLSLPTPQIRGPSIFYPPIVLDDTNPNNIAVGTDRINLDTAQGTGGFPDASEISLPGVTGTTDRVSAISYVNSNLIYVGTANGRVLRCDRAGGVWTVRALQAAPLPSRWIWDVEPLPTDLNTVVVVMAGFGVTGGHVWRGAVPAAGAATWTAISGGGASSIPDVPCNALQIDPLDGNTIYVGTDVGVFRTTNGGTSWANFSQGLPNVAIYDLDLHESARLLRVATHGRGLWERLLDSVPPDVHLFVRDHMLHGGRGAPPNGLASPHAEPLHGVALGDQLFAWQCADIKVDAPEGSPPAFQTPLVGDVDYVVFEGKLAHRNPQRGVVNRVYVQVHNRGIQAANNVVVKLYYADATAGAPDLPADFWTTFPGDPAPGVWKPVGPAQTIPVVIPTEPSLLEWNWTVPMSAAPHTCMLAVIDSASDPIPPASKVFGVWALVNNERRVGWKNLHVVNAVPGAVSWTPLQFFGAADRRYSLRFGPASAGGWRLGFVLPKATPAGFKTRGLTAAKPTDQQLKALRLALGDGIDRFDATRLFRVSQPAKGGALDQVLVGQKGLTAMVMLAAPASAGGSGVVTVVQELDGQQLAGGSTYVLNLVRAK